MRNVSGYLRVIALSAAAAFSAAAQEAPKSPVLQSVLSGYSAPAGGLKGCQALGLTDIGIVKRDFRLHGIVDAQVCPVGSKTLECKEGEQELKLLVARVLPKKPIANARGCVPVGQTSSP